MDAITTLDVLPRRAGHLAGAVLRLGPRSAWSSWSPSPACSAVFIKPSKVYPLYGFHDRVHRAIARMTNAKFFTHLFGDSSYIVHYLRWLGYDLGEVVQTGSNFGTRRRPREPVPEHRRQRDDGRRRAVDHQRRLLEHVLPRLAGRPSGRDNFLGNNIAYPAGGQDGRQLPARDEGDGPARRQGPRRGGAARLAAVRDPADGRARPGGSTLDGDELRRRLRAKNRHNLRTMGIFLLVRWLHVFLVTALRAGRLRRVRRVRPAARWRSCSR